MPNFVFNPEKGYEIPQDRLDDAIWRYVDLPKFLLLLESKSLFLCRLDKFDDLSEGSMPASLIKERNDKLIEQSKQGKRPMLSADVESLILTRRRNTAVNCWHISRTESVAMWKLYAVNNFGLAIRSTIRKLGACLSQYNGEDVETQKYKANPTVLPLEIGIVNYIDFSDPAASRSVKVNKLHYYKREGFGYEQEIRLVCSAQPHQGDSTEYSVFPNGGERVSADPATLIDAVYLAPQAPPWYVEIIQRALKRSKIRCDIHYSELGRPPTF